MRFGRNSEPFILWKDVPEVFCRFEREEAE